MRGRATAGWAMVLAALCPIDAPAASFDCARAASPAERAICADPKLSELDEYLGRYFAAAREALKGAASCLQSEQRAWLQRRDRCADNACRQEAYLDRLAELDPLQPGATALKNVELPVRPGLVWVVPPAADRVAAPPNPKAVPGELVGTILDEVSGGDGFVVRSAAGERRLLVPLMFLEPGTAARLEALAREQGANFVVRGHVAAEGTRKFFEPSRCIYIHRVATPAEGAIADPNRAPPGFKPHELAFATPKDGVARAEYRSVPFYAVILKTATRCSVKEAERREVQALFPSNKVFATRFGCEDGVEEHVTYTNVDRKWGFMAVYAGSTRAEADRFLVRVAATGRFAGANVRQLQAVLVYP